MLKNVAEGVSGLKDMMCTMMKKVSNLQLVPSSNTVDSPNKSVTPNSLIDSDILIQNEVEEISNIKTYDRFFSSSAGKNWRLIISEDDEYSAVIECVYCTEKDLRQSGGKINVKLNNIVWARLKWEIKRHLEGPNHKSSLNSHLSNMEVLKKIHVQNEIMGLRCARLVHNIIFESGSYHSYERWLCFLSLILDVGNQQHSRKFAAAFAKSMSTIVQARLCSLITAPLECTGGRLRPISFTADKSTMKGITYQPVGIQTVILKNNYVKENLFIATPRLSGTATMSIASNIVSSYTDIGLSLADIILSVTGACLDGEYFTKNIISDIANLLKLEGDQRSNFLLHCIWDPAHRLELSDQHSREKTPIVTEFFTLVHEMINDFSGKTRAEITSLAEEMKLKVYQPRKKSTTRFVAHEHKVLCNQYRNWKPQYFYYEKLGRDESLKGSDIIDAQNHARDRQSVRKITLLLSMIEITDILSRTSCMLQENSAFPWEHLEVINVLLQRLKYTRDCFDDGRVPISLDPPQVSTKEIIPVRYDSNGLGYQPWDVMKSNLPHNGYFQKDVPVLLEGEIENRHITRFLKRRAQETNTIKDEISAVLKQLSTQYLRKLIDYVEQYFISGQNPSCFNTKPPKWINLSKLAFDFLNDTMEYDTMKNSFVDLLPTLIQPLTEVETKKAVFQYSILHDRMISLASTEKIKCLKNLIYKFCTDAKMFKDCELATHIMLYNTVVASSECVIESLISRIEEHNTNSRPLSDDQLNVK